jgi:hypothetical protein
MRGFGPPGHDVSVVGIEKGVPARFMCGLGVLKWSCGGISWWRKARIVLITPPIPDAASL